jgi:hypothetical protein
LDAAVEKVADVELATDLSGGRPVSRVPIGLNTVPADDAKIGDLS